MKKILIPLAACLGLQDPGFFSPQTWGAEIDPQQIVTILPKDAIPAILDPRGMLVDAREADRELDDQEDVMGVSLQGESRAYPFSVLSQRRVVNDQALGRPVLVVFDRERATGAVFDRWIQGTAHHFELVSGSQGRLILVDKETKSRWLGLKGEAIEGKLKGQRLEQIPTHYAFWFAWKDYYPRTELFK